MENNNCLNLCLEYITWVKDRKFDLKTPHKWKEDIINMGQENWWKIIYYNKFFITTTTACPYYIQIYKTARGTTHAVVCNRENHFIIYNPNKIQDLVEKTGRLEFILKSDPLPPS